MTQCGMCLSVICILHDVLEKLWSKTGKTESIVKIMKTWISVLIGFIYSSHFKLGCVKMLYRFSVWHSISVLEVYKPMMCVAVGGFLDLML